MAFIVVYLSIGAALAIIGCWLHSLSWSCTFLHSLKDGASLWIIGALLWPLGLDLLLFHDGHKYKDYE